MINNHYNELLALARQMQVTTQHLPLGVHGLGDFAEPSAENLASIDGVRAFGQKLYEEGGPALMTKVYDDVVEQWGDRSVRGVSSVWHGVGGWMH